MSAHDEAAVTGKPNTYGDVVADGVIAPGVLEKFNVTVHPYADQFPLVPEIEMTALAADIANNGLKQKIKRCDGQIIDGRNRLVACVIAGIEPEFEDLDIDDDGVLRANIDSANMQRRHMPVHERALIAASLVTTTKGRSKGNASRDAFSQTDAATKFGLSRKTVQRAYVVLSGSPELIAAVRRGEVSLAEAEKKIRPKKSGKKKPAGTPGALDSTAQGPTPEHTNEPTQPAEQQGTDPGGDRPADETEAQPPEEPRGEPVEAPLMPPPSQVLSHESAAEQLDLDKAPTTARVARIRVTATITDEEIKRLVGQIQDDEEKPSRVLITLAGSDGYSKFENAVNAVVAAGYGVTFAGRLRVDGLLRFWVAMAMACDPAATPEAHINLMFNVAADCVEEGAR